MKSNSTRADQVPASSSLEFVCPRYEIIYEYIRVTGRSLTGTEQRAFLYLLDLDADERFAHDVDQLDDEGNVTHKGECICMDIMPAILEALDPEPIDANVATRNLDGETCPAQRWHTEKVGRFQGIVIDEKTKAAHANDLRKLARKQLQDLIVVVRELVNRSGKRTVKNDLAEVGELVTLIGRRRPAPAALKVKAELAVKPEAKVKDIPISRLRGKALIAALDQVAERIRNGPRW